MNWKEYTIEVITTCISAGADQLKAEIRIPSIRGQVRWWFRALGGTRSEEKTLFGGVHGEAEKSKVIFRLKEPLISDLSQNLNDLVGNNLNHPQAYLLWPLRPTRDSQQKRGMIRPHSTFTLRHAVDARFKNPALIEKLAASVEAWILLGSLGTRSRRGFGSLGFHADQGGGIFSSPEQMRQVIQKVLRTFGRPRIKAMLLSGPHSTAEESLNYLGNWLKGFRAGSRRSGIEPSTWGRNDHDAALGRAGKVFRPVLGLPLSQRFSGDRTEVKTEFDGAERWASPVHLKVVRCGDTFYPLAVFFPEMAIPDGASVTLSNRRGPDWDLPVDHGLLNRMMTPGQDAFVLYEY